MHPNLKFECVFSSTLTLIFKVSLIIAFCQKFYSDHSILDGMRPAQQPSLLAALNVLRNDTQLSAPDREFYDNAHFLLSRVIEMAAM